MANLGFEYQHLDRIDGLEETNRKKDVGRIQ